VGPTETQRARAGHRGRGPGLPRRRGGCGGDGRPARRGAARYGARSRHLGPAEGSPKRRGSHSSSPSSRSRPAHCSRQPLPLLRSLSRSSLWSTASTDAPWPILASRYAPPPSQMLGSRAERTRHNAPAPSWAMQNRPRRRPRFGPNQYSRRAEPITCKAPASRARAVAVAVPDLVAAPDGQPRNPARARARTVVGERRADRGPKGQPGGPPPSRWTTRSCGRTTTGRWTSPRPSTGRRSAR
jgi:hypothetical protein